jgi:hypothetical protein
LPSKFPNLPHCHLFENFDPLVAIAVTWLDIISLAAIYVPVHPAYNPYFHYVKKGQIHQRCDRRHTKTCL